MAGMGGGEGEKKLLQETALLVIQAADPSPLSPSHAE